MLLLVPALAVLLKFFSAFLISAEHLYLLPTINYLLIFDWAFILLMNSPVGINAVVFLLPRKDISQGTRGGGGGGG